MKQRILLMAALLVAAGLQSVSAQTAMKVWRGSNFEIYRTSEVDSVQFVNLVSEIQLSQTSAELEKGKTLQLTATVLPEDADEMKVTWQSSIPSVASVDEKGLLTAMAVGSCIVTCSATDGSGVKATCQVTVKSNGQVEPDEHEWVDLGLPSGTLWATMNVGASSIEDAGAYFAWGETQPKEAYTWDTFSEAITTKYSNEGGKTELDAEDDVATANWGSHWQMPSDEQCAELLNEEYTTIEKHVNEGCLITSKANGKSIFLPVTGYIDDTYKGNKDKGYYWTRTRGGKTAGYSLELDLYDQWTGVYTESFFYGQCVRPVRVAE